MDSGTMIIIPIVMFIMIGAVTLGALWLLYLSRRDHHETIRQAMDMGQPLDSAFQATLNGLAASPHSDARASVIAGCLAVSFVVVAVLNGLTGGSVLASRIGAAIGIILAGYAGGRLLAARLSPNVERQSGDANPETDS